MPHHQEPTDDSILSADGLAAYSASLQYRQGGEEEERTRSSAQGAERFRGGKRHGGDVESGWGTFGREEKPYELYRGKESYFSPSTSMGFPPHERQPHRPHLPAPPSSSSSYYASHLPAAPPVRPPLPTCSTLPPPLPPSLYSSHPAYPPNRQSTPDDPAPARRTPSSQPAGGDGQYHPPPTSPPSRRLNLPSSERYDPPPSTRERELEWREAWRRDPWDGEEGDVGGGGGWGEDDGDDEGGGGGGEGEFHHPAGSYLHGVGFDTHHLPSSPAAKAKVGQKAAARLARLERQFGPSSPASPSAPALGGLSKKDQIGAGRAAEGREKKEREERDGVDDKGRLVVGEGGGKRKRLALQWAQGVGAVVVGAGAIGAALLTHPATPPAPQDSAPLYALYLLPFISLFLTLYFHLVRPLLYSRRARQALTAGQAAQMGAQGMSFPLQYAPPPGGGREGGGGCCGRRKTRVPRSVQQQLQQGGEEGATVNLVIDRAMFPALLGGGGGRDRIGGGRRREEDEERRKRRRRREKKERRKKRAERERRRARKGKGKGGESEEEDDNTLVPSSSSSSVSSLSSSSSADEDDPWSSTGHLSFGGHGLLSPARFAAEATWLAARSWAKKVAVMEGAMGVVWAATGVWAIGWGGKCPAGGGEGWCNLYNTALAFSVLTSLAFLTSSALGWVDLMRGQGGNPRLKQQLARTGGRGGRERGKGEDEV